ncbi:flagellar motor protein MotB [Azospirillum sp. RWY-5-1]|uniref:Flagellar motor protein MotB n=2 Tax=Azospirillum oleiclasticum TaxID=2735135 RepID=A0ABX2TJQ1_9PROT|nr:type IVB secretion system protein IcmH/DotU [Azospirillum oleiclasticum]NYZ16705.1 flagellar motor protein MotB [Azospirillum oleiclasticum]NYZ23393.1 flagellar motor protein MotB [Azospirillum oleiclasticum]
MVAEATVDEAEPVRVAAPRRLQPAGGPPAPRPNPATAPAATTGFARVCTARNPLLAAASPLLARIAELQARSDLPPPELLEGELRVALARFVETAAAAGCPAPALRAGRFALAATIDDALGAALHRRLSPPGDGGGPDRFFDRLGALLTDPRHHRHALELFHACLSLGFMGRYRDRPGGGAELDRLRGELFRVLRRLDPPSGRALSPAPAPPDRRTGRRPLPVRAIAATVLGAALLGYGALAATLSGRAGTVAERLDALAPEAPVELARTPPPPATAGPALVARLAEALRPEIRARSAEVLAGSDGALVIRVPAAGMFPVDGDAVGARYRAVLDRVGQALAVEAGMIVVVAHMDDLFAPTARFPTPDALTAARAASVVRILESHLPAARLSAVGLGRREPLAPGRDAASRGRNRRIDIRLYPF